MKDDRFLALFDAERISPNIRETQGGGPSVYFAGGYAPSLAALKEMNESATIGQVGGSRRKSRKSKKSKKSRSRSSYRRRR